jgi:hypothetical protein
MGSRGQTLIKELASVGKYNQEKIIITGGTLKNNNIQISLNLALESSLKDDDVFYLIKKCRISNMTQKEYFNVYKSEVRKMINHKSNFNNLKIPSTILCNGEFENLISIEVHSLNSNTILCSLETTVQNLLFENKKFDLNDGKNKFIIFVNASLIKEHTFLEYSNSINYRNRFHIQ